jgi:hypothetical protein
MTPSAAYLDLAVRPALAGRAPIPLGPSLSPMGPHVNIAFIPRALRRSSAATPEPVHRSLQW